MRKSLSILAVLSCLPCWMAPRAWGAPFVNLDFEQAQVVFTTPPIYISAAAAFPGWQVLANGQPFDGGGYNYSGIGEPVMGLYDRPVSGILSQGPLQGLYTALPRRSSDGSVRVSLRQVGDVPPGTQTLRILGANRRPPPVVMLESQALQFVQTTTSPFPGGEFPVEFAADIAQFSGAPGTRLEIISPPIGIDAFAFIDDIRFSPAPIPEPRSLALLISVPTLWLPRRRRRWRPARIL